MKQAMKNYLFTVMTWNDFEMSTKEKKEKVVTLKVEAHNEEEAIKEASMIINRQKYEVIAIESVINPLPSEV